MGRLSFYVLWSVRDAPRQFISKSNRASFHVHVPLPLPKHLVIFGLGEWKCRENTISVDVVVSAEVPAQRIGTLSAEARCLTWEGDWSSDIAFVAEERGRKGMYGKIVLTMSGELLHKSAVSCSTPLVQRKCLFPEQEQHSVTDCYRHDTITSNSSHLVDSVCYSEIQVPKVDTSDPAIETKPPVWPPDKTTRQSGPSKRGRGSWSCEDLDSLAEDIDRASTPKKTRLSSQEEMNVQKTNEDRGVCPSKRWSHTMCLTDADTAILIGGETTNQNYCEDSMWKLELDTGYWFPLKCFSSGPFPPCAQGHSATYDPDSKSVFVYGGLREGQQYSELYILNTLTWKWKLVTARGKVPNLAYHSAVFYKKELFVFGGVQTSHAPGEKSCSNALYIFNQEYELWYQPIVEGEKPLPRFGHSATLLSHKLIIFGGRKTVTYLNDLHVLDLGFMEYTAVKCGNMLPLPRGFHAALPVSDNKILISGGCSAIGTLQDVHIYNIDTHMWNSVTSPLLCSKPRAGHSIVKLGCSIQTDAEKQQQQQQLQQDGNGLICCPLLVFGGSDCSGAFYNDTVRCTVEIPTGK